MTFSTREFTPAKQWLLIALSVGLATLVAVACSLPNPTDKMKKDLAKHGAIDAEWEIRDEDAGKTYTYILLRNKTNTHETYQLVATDNTQKVERDQLGGIDANGCFLLPKATATPWIQQKPPEILEDAEERNGRLDTPCLEYEDTAAWPFIPAEDRKAAEPPPPPPEPAAGPDAGTADAGAEEPGGIESTLPE